MAPTGSAPPAPFASLEHLTTARVRYVVAFMAIWIYDWLALLPEEREAIWQAKASVGKGLFLFLRYFSLFHVLCSSLLLLLPVSPRICGGMFWLEPFGGMLITFLSLVILSLRVSAIYNQSWTIMTSLSVMLVAIAGWLVYDMTLFAAMQLPAQVADAVHFHGCIAAPRDPSASNVMTSAWAAPLLADSILVVLTLYRSRDLVKRMSSSAVNPPLISKIMSSGVLYYICITSSNLVNTILYSLPNASPTLKVFHVSASDVLTSLLTARLVLSLFAYSPTPSTSLNTTNDNPGLYPSRLTPRLSPSKRNPSRHQQASIAREGIELPCLWQEVDGEAQKQASEVISARPFTATSQEGAGGIRLQRQIVIV